MASLPEATLRKVWRGLMRWWSKADTQEDTGFTKDEFYTAVEQSDIWVDTNQVSYNTYINTNAPAFGTNASANQKSILLVAVTLARFDPELLRSLLGEVD